MFNNHNGFVNNDYILMANSHNSLQLNYIWISNLNSLDEIEATWWCISAKYATKVSMEL